MPFLNIISFLVSFFYQTENFKKLNNINLISYQSHLRKKVELAPPNTYQWIGITFDYQDPNNWLPKRTSLSNNDILIFNAASPSPTKVQNLPSQTIGQLIIKDSKQVGFEGINPVTAFSISGLAGDDLYIESGSSLTLKSANAIEMNILSGANANIFGDFITSTINLTQPNHRLLIADAGACIFQNGATFLAEALTANPFGALLPVNTVIFKSGSKYISQAGANPFGIASVTQSKVVFEKGSLYSHQQTSGLSLAGRTYADFELNIGNGVDLLVSAGSTSSTCKMDNIHIISGNLNFLLSLNQAVNIFLYGDLIVESGAFFNYSPATVWAFSTFTIAGNFAQNLKGKIIFGQNTILSIENSNSGPNDINLNGNIDCNGYLFLKNGIINTGSNYLFAQEISPTYLGDNNSHINGNLKIPVKAGVINNFPVGDGQHLQKIAIKPDCAGDYTASFIKTNPNSSPLNPFIENNANFTEILPDGFWTINSTTCKNANYEIYTFPQNFLNFPVGKAAYTIAKRDLPGNWLKDGNILNADNTLTGVQNDFSLRRKNMKAFSGFSIVASPFVALPIIIKKFDYEKSNDKIIIKWATQNEKDEVAILEKSTDGKLFNEIEKELIVNEINGEFHFNDFEKSEKNFYRLKYSDEHKNVIYSKTIFVGQSGDLKFIINPNPIENNFNIKFPFTGQADLNIININGYAVMKVNGTLEDIENTLKTKIPNLAAGVYLIKLIQGQQVFFCKMVKQ